MQQSKFRIMILSQDDALSSEAAQAAASGAFSDPDAKPEVRVLQIAKTDRINKLNEWFSCDPDSVERFLVLDADQLPPDSWNAIADHFKTHAADICCICDPAPQDKSFTMHRNRYAQYLCANSAFLAFSEKAVRRMRTADTTDFIEEAIQSAALSVQVIPKRYIGFNTKQPGISAHLHLMRCRIDAGSVLIACAAAGLAGTLIFLILLMIGQIKIGSIGCIVGIHVFLLSAAVLLIRWYRRSAKHEQKKHAHPYVEESHLK